MKRSFDTEEAMAMEVARNIARRSGLADLSPPEPPVPNKNNKFTFGKVPPRESRLLPELEQPTLADMKLLANCKTALISAEEVYRLQTLKKSEALDNLVSRANEIITNNPFGDEGPSSKRTWQMEIPRDARGTLIYSLLVKAGYRVKSKDGMIYWNLRKIGKSD